MYTRILGPDGDETVPLAAALQRAGLRVTVESELECALASCTVDPADLVVITAGISDPLSAIRRFRSSTLNPLVVITSSPDEKLCAVLLEGGADLVLSRPYSPSLLIRQLQALLRRSLLAHSRPLSAASQTPVVLDPSTLVLQMGIFVAPSFNLPEHRLLYALLTDQNQIFPLKALIGRASDDRDRSNINAIRDLIGRLRMTTGQMLERVDQFERELESATDIGSTGGDGFAVHPTTKSIQVGDLVLDLQAWHVMRGEEPVHLSKTEFRLLACLAQHAGHVVTYNDLLETVWDYAPGTGDPNIVTSCVRRIRRKLGESAGQPDYIFAIQGVGYRLGHS